MSEERNFELELEELNKKKAELEASLKEIEEAKKMKLAEDRKIAANEVNYRIDMYEEAKVTCEGKIREAYEAYCKATEEAKRELNEKKAEVDEALNDFLKNYDSFHYTYKSKDGSRKREYNYTNKISSTFDSFDKFAKAFRDLLY